MGPRTSIAAGLVGGLSAAVLFYAALVALAPETGDAMTPPPSLEASPSPTASLSVPDGSGASASPGTPGSSLAAEFMVGQPAPPLRVTQLGGGTMDLAALRGSPVWVEFMATWCPSCREELPRMAELAARYQDAGLVILLVDVREDESAVTAFMSSLGVDLPVGLDSDGSALAAWRGLALPVHYWIDASGTIRAGAVGALPPDVMASDLATILPGADAAP